MFVINMKAETPLARGISVSRELTSAAFSYCPANMGNGGCSEACDLERGCYIVAALDLLLSVAAVIYGSADLAHFSEIEGNR